MIPGFSQGLVVCGDVRVSVRPAGQGTPLILLQVYRQMRHGRG